MFPDGADTFATPNPFPLLDTGDSTGVYLEAICASKIPRNSYANLKLSLTSKHDYSGRVYGYGCLKRFRVFSFNSNKAILLSTSWSSDLFGEIV